MFGFKLNQYELFNTLEVVGRGSETQLQVCENLNNLSNRFKHVELLTSYCQFPSKYNTWIVLLIWCWSMVYDAAHSPNQCCVKVFCLLARLKWYIRPGTKRSGFVSRPAATF